MKSLKHYLPTVDPPEEKILVQGKIKKELYARIAKLKKSGKWSWDDILEGAVKAILDLEGDKNG